MPVAGMKSYRVVRTTKPRFPLVGLLTASCLGLFPAFASSQELPPCVSGTQLLTVASTSDAVTLASSLQCSSGTFVVEWFGKVIVSETINITDGTSVNITGATSDATADGGHTTQLFVVDGASSALHLTDMVLSNGHADYGGAVYAAEQASVSFDGNMTFASNNASYGGAICAEFATVFWDGERTTFSNNSASYHGGAILAQTSSSLSWGGETMFIRNSADDRGGGILVSAKTNISWQGNMSFLDNFANAGGAVMVQHSSLISWAGETVFKNNDATHWGGGVYLFVESNMSWMGNTTFLNNSAHSLGGAVFAFESSNLSWSGKATFERNTARRGGVIYAHSSTVVWDGDDTVFSDNYASFYGGALAAEGSSTVSWGGRAVFIDNSAYYRGGALFANESSSMCWSSKTTFTANTAWRGGAIYALSSSVAWDGEGTTFSNNTALAYYGGAIVAESSSQLSWNGTTLFVDNSALSNGGAVCVLDHSNVSWGGETRFVNNNVPYWGGGLFVTDYSNISWTGNTTFLNNYAQDGGGLFIYDHSIGAWNGTTTFEKNTVSYTGGGLTVHSSSYASWAGETTVTNNAAHRAGAMFVWASDVSWTGNTTFADNIAYTDGGAVYATVASHVYCQGTTMFRNNTATYGNGGAFGIYGYGSSAGSYVKFSGETTFANNVALLNGGGVFSSANAQGQYFEGVTFWSNSAGIGGAVAAFGTGNNDETTTLPTTFSRCHFIGNTATETGGAVETAFGHEEIIASRFENNSADVGGAVRLGGATTILDCFFISNMASSSGLAVAAVGSVEINGSSFDRNVFFCEEGEYLHTVKGTSGTARYESVCGGCPSWEDCQNCAVGENASEPICSMALQHTTANESGSTLATLSVDEGYWRATGGSDTILACYNPDACGGGQTGTDSFCNDGYTGAYCSVCQSGYSSSLSTTCTRCSSSRRQWLVATTVIAGIVAVCTMAVFTQYLVSTNFEERKTICIHHRMLRWVPLQALRIVIVVWQILTQFASVANVTYPGVYQTFLSGINFINLDVGFVISAGCLWSDIDFHDRLLAGTIWPLSILGLLGMTYSIALRRNSAADNSVRDEIRNKHLSAVLLLLFFVYSSVSSTVFRMFACDPLDDGLEYLRADYRIMCTDNKHRALQVYAGLMIAVYPVGIPLLFGVLLYRNRGVLSDCRADKAAAQSIASLWAPYRPNRYYYEVVECGRRIMLTGVVVFIYPNDTAQIAITIINSFFFFVVSEVLSPYESASDTWVSRSGHVLIFFSMFDVLLLRVDVSQESSQSQQVLAGVLVTGHVVMIVAVVAEAIAIWFAARRKRRVVEEHTPSQRALRVPSMPIGQEEVDSEDIFHTRSVLGS